MKNLKKLSALVLAITLLAAVAVSAYDPDNTDDPILTQSYVNTVVIPYVDNATAFSVVNLSQNQMLIGEAGCEIILRMGTASVIATEKGGLCDTTIGGDWPNGSAVPGNHLLIVPVSDGRGVKADSDIIVMVKGKYTLY